jgi:hypothetical protein
MDCLRIDPHLNPKPDSSKRHPIAICGPFDPPDQRAELMFVRVWSAAQASERSGETRGKCPEKARSRSGHALVAS